MTANQLKIEVEVHGGGDPVVMVHGLGGTSNVFTPQTGALSEHFHVIRPDLPGSGRSRTDGKLSIESLADSVLQVIESLALKPAHLVGHSMGTVVCQHLAVKHPGLIRSLVLIGPLAAPPEAARPNIRARAARARTEGMPGIADAIVQGGTSEATRSGSPQAVTLIRELLMRQDPEGYALSCEALADAQPAAVESLRCPTLLITGDEDAVAPPAAVAALAARIPGSQTVVLQHCGHWATVERPQEITRELLKFYDNQE